MGYAAEYQKYFERGWKSVLPLPPRMKKPPPNGYTGYKAQIPSYPDLVAWAEDNADGNLGLRMPSTVVGIDVDAYGDKSGEACLAEALNRWGVLPPTVRSTSRQDGISGIRMYRVPAEINLHTEIVFPELGLGNIEVCQDFHRYVVAYPSIHPDTGLQYVWLNEQGEQVEIPNIEDLPYLPRTWINGLRTEVTEVTRSGDVAKFLDSLKPGPMDRAVEKTLQDAFRHLDTDPGSRHDAAMRDVGRLIRLQEEGKTGVKSALIQLGKAFVKSVQNDRPGGDIEATSEYDRMITNRRIHDVIASSPSEEAVRSAELYELAGKQRVGQEPTERPLFSDPAPETPYVAEQRGDVDSAGSTTSTTGMARANSFLFSDHDDDRPAYPEEPTVDRSELPFTQRLCSIEELGTLPPASPLIDGLLYRNTLAQIAGDPGSFKTFFTLGLAMAVASNLNSWEGYPIAYHGTVVYVAAEGLSGMRARALAWCEDQNVDPETVRIKFFPDAFNLDSWEDVQQIIQMVEDTDAVLLVLDTRARVTGRLKENDATEQGEAIEALETIRKRRNTTILAVHHSARGGAAGRGSNAWDGAVWTELRSGRDGDMGLKVHCEKHKDVESGCDHEFEMHKRTVSYERMPGVDEAGRTTLVVRQKNMLGGNKPDLKELEGIVKIVAEHAPKEGLTIAQIVEISGIPKTTAYRQLRAAERLGQLVDVNDSGKTTRYAVPPS